MNGITRRQFLGASGTLALAAFKLGACSPESNSAQMRDRTFFCLDTVCSINGVMEQALLDEAVALCERYEQLFSRTLEGSDVSRINSARGEPVEVDHATADIIEASLEYSRASEGLFDITIGAVSTLWDFKSGRVPDPEEVERALPHIGYMHVGVEGDTVTLADPEARIDLGGIAKGYIADAIGSVLESNGCMSACINLGGNVKTVGFKPDGSSWNVGIQDPNSKRGEIIAQVESAGTSVVTSGLYARQFELDGKRYWHILDPRTGYPVATDLMSATIVSDRSIDGDGLTKPLFMFGAEEALTFLELRDGVEGYLVYASGDVAATDGCTVTPR